MYKVPLDKPKYCNCCPYSVLRYSHPKWAKEKPDTHGYVCYIGCKTKKHGEILEAKYDENVKKPKWCPLKEVK